MNTFRVNVKVTGTGYVLVDAKDEEEARRLVERIANHDLLAFIYEHEVEIDLDLTDVEKGEVDT